MLLGLNIRNFSIIRELVIDFGAGMTIVTGETGAGKSILIDALSLCLGERAEVSMIRQETERAEICATFSIAELPLARLWLQENQFDELDECVLRRILTVDGRSRSFINGRNATLSQLKELGQQLIQIYGQNTHQALLKAETPRYILDQYAQHQAILGKLKQKITDWYVAQRSLAEYKEQQQADAMRLQLLHYQLKELKEFAPKDGEFFLIETEHQRLSHSGKLIELTSQASLLFSGNQDVNILQLLHQVKRHLEELIMLDSSLESLNSQLDEVLIQLASLAEDLDDYGQNIDLDSSKLVKVEERLTNYLLLARKHQVKPDVLYELYQQLSHEYQTIRGDETQEEKLLEQVSQTHQEAVLLAKQLHAERVKHAKVLSRKMTELMKELAMPHGKFEVLVEDVPEMLNETGSSRVEFYVTTNPGQPLGLLSKVVSGGELSRLALALQVITLQQRGMTGMIFDEIDVGISGSTASRIGQLLRHLAELTQVMCVTHLPQVAGYGQHHFFVNKIVNNNETIANIELLDKQGRLNELARLLSGGKITKNSLANAEELLVM